MILHEKCNMRDNVGQPPRLRGSANYTSFVLWFQQYVLSLINDRRKKLGYEDRASDDRLTVLLRRDLNIWACNFNDVECVTTYINKFQKWKANRSIP